MLGLNRGIRPESAGKNNTTVNTPSFRDFQDRDESIISYYSNKSEYYSTGVLLLLSHRVLIDFVIYFGYRKQRKYRAFTAHDEPQKSRIYCLFSVIA
jgi:hypothetical protein